MQLLAWLAAALVFGSFFMKTIVPLRTVAIGSNIVFICYALTGIHFGIFDKVLPILVLHLALLPLNIVRLKEIKATIKSVRAIADNKPTVELLIPYMTYETRSRGDCIFNKGDPADRIYLLKKGVVRLVEIDKTLTAGELFGEIGVFSEHATRTLSICCEEDCELHSITGGKVIELFFQDPRFGFLIVQTLSRYAANAPATTL